MRYNPLMFTGLEPKAIASPSPASLAHAPDGGIIDLAVEACQRLRALNVHLLTEPVKDQGDRLVFFADCGGNYLDLVQRRQPLP